MKSKHRWWLQLLNKNRLFITTFGLITLLFTSNISHAEQINYQNWPSQITNDASKVWTVHFNTQVSKSTVTWQNIYILDNLNRRIYPKLIVSDDNLSVRVLPSSPYSTGNYQLYLTNGLRSQDGKPLIDPTIFQFSVQLNQSVTNSNATNNSTSSQTRQPSSSTTSTTSANAAPQSTNNTDSNLISDVNIIANPYVTSVTLKADPTIGSVSVQNQKMHYSGNHQFTQMLVGVKRGDLVTIDAFDASNNKVFSKKYSVE
jgi:hypothetical protein